MLNNKEDYVLFFLIIILVSYLMMNKEKFTNSSHYDHLYVSHI